MDSHYQFTTFINTAPLKGEMSVLFSGMGDPVGGHFIGPAVHDFYLVHIVLDGEGVFETLGETYELKAGDAFVIFPDILVRYEASMHNPWKYMWVAFSGDIADKSLQSLAITPDQAVLRGCSVETMNRLFGSLRDSLQRREFPELGNMEASGWLRMILFELGKWRESEWKAANSTGDASPLHGGADARIRSGRHGHKEHSHLEYSHSYRQIDQAIRLLSLQYGQQLSIETIARSLGYHRAHLTKLFKEATGLSPMQYLFKVRMKKAENLLTGTDLSIAQIASSVGYSDPLFFSKQFRKWSSKSPTEYRLDASGH